MDISETSFCETPSTTVVISRTVSRPYHVYATSCLVFGADFDTETFSITRMSVSCDLRTFQQQLDAINNSYNQQNGFKISYLDHVTGHVMS